MQREPVRCAAESFTICSPTIRAFCFVFFHGIKQVSRAITLINNFTQATRESVNVYNQMNNENILRCWRGKVICGNSILIAYLSKSWNFLHHSESAYVIKNHHCILLLKMTSFTCVFSKFRKKFCINFSLSMKKAFYFPWSKWSPPAL